MEDHYEPLIYTMNAADVPPEPPSAKDNHRRLPGTLVALEPKSRPKDNTADSQDRDPELGDGKSGYTRTQETQPDTGEMNKGKKAAVKSTTADTSTLNGNNGKRAKKEKCCSVKWTIIAILIVVFILAIICAIVGGIGYWQGWFSKSSS